MQSVVKFFLDQIYCMQIADTCVAILALRALSLSGTRQLGFSLCDVAKYVVG